MRMNVSMLFEGRNALVWGAPEEGKGYTALEDFLGALQAGIECPHNMELNDDFYTWCDENKVNALLAVYVDWASLGHCGGVCPKCGGKVDVKMFKGVRPDGEQDVCRSEKCGWTGLSAWEAFRTWYLGKDGPRNCRMYFDEAHKYFRQSDQDDHDDDFETCFSQPRKAQNVHVIITQFAAKLSKKVRDNVGFNYECKNFALRDIGRRYFRVMLPQAFHVMKREKLETQGTKTIIREFDIPFRMEIARLYRTLGTVGKSAEKLNDGAVVPPPRAQGLLWAYAAIVLAVFAFVSSYFNSCSARKESQTEFARVKAQIRDGSRELEKKVEVAVAKRPVPVVEAQRIAGSAVLGEGVKVLSVTSAKRLQDAVKILPPRGTAPVVAPSVLPSATITPVATVTVAPVPAPIGSVTTEPTVKPLAPVPPRRQYQLPNADQALPADWWNARIQRTFTNGGLSGPRTIESQPNSGR